MSKKSKNKDKAAENSEEAATVQEVEDTSGSKSPEDNNPLGKALVADEKSATKGKSNSDRHKSTKIIPKKNSSTDSPRENPEDTAEEEYFPPAERKAHKRNPRAKPYRIPTMSKRQRRKGKEK